MRFSSALSLVLLSACGGRVRAVDEAPVAVMDSGVAEFPVDAGEDASDVALEAAVVDAFVPPPITVLDASEPPPIDCGAGDDSPALDDDAGPAPSTTIIGCLNMSTCQMGEACCGAYEDSGDVYFIACRTDCDSLVGHRQFCDPTKCGECPPGHRCVPSSALASLSECR